jgi:mono/diheme cytochrome c family protein
MTRTLRISVLMLLVAVSFGLVGCRGDISATPPVHLVLDMDFQPKLRTQSTAEFEGFADHRAMRMPVGDGFGNTWVVARGSLPNAKLAHKDAAGKFVSTNPLAADAKVKHLGRETTVIERGRERFEIFCAVCHGHSGQGGFGPQGHGLVGRRWKVAIPNFHFDPAPGKDNRVPMLSDGELFDVITNGKATMPSYGARISPEDRWAIIHYVRALQTLSK